MVRETRRVPGYRPMPILFNEDDHFDFDKPENNFAARRRRVRLVGLLRLPAAGEPFATATSPPPVDWGINHARKRAFFEMVRAVTGGDSTPPRSKTTSRQD